MVCIIVKILKCLSTSILYFLIRNIDKYCRYSVAGNLGTSEINLCKSSHVLHSVIRLYVFLCHYILL